MDGRRAPDPLRLAAGVAATAGGALQRVIGFGVDTARLLPGVDPLLVTLEERGTQTLRNADELADRLLHAVLRRIVQVALQEVDLTTIVRDHVDLDVVAEGIDIQRIIDRVDVDSVIGRVDLVVLADTVIEGVDLPRIIRESTDSMSNEAVRGVRTQGMQADDAVAGFVGKFFGRGHEPGDA